MSEKHETAIGIGCSHFVEMTTRTAEKGEVIFFPPFNTNNETLIHKI